MADPTVNLVLDDVTFQGVEIPATINFGGKQALVLHDLIGGTRVIDAMGAFTEPITWAGWLIGSTASDRANLLNQKRISGKQFTLSWHEQRFTVVVSHFKADFQRPYQIQYSITCEVVSDQTSPASSSDTQSVDTLITEDMLMAADLTDQLDALPPITAGTTSTSTLSAAMAGLQSAVASVNSFAKATQSQLNSVLQPIAAVRGQITQLTAAANNALQNVTTLGGILPNNPLSVQVSRLGKQVAAVEQLPLLVSLDRVVGRVASNAKTNYTTSRQITQAGGNLYTLAAQQYGDATAWTTLARANNLTDPFLTGINTITVPPYADGADGVLEF